MTCDFLFVCLFLIRLSATGFSLVDAWISYDCNGFKMALFQVHPSLLPAPVLAAVYSPIRGAIAPSLLCCSSDYSCACAVTWSAKISYYVAHATPCVISAISSKLALCSSNTSTPFSFLCVVSGLKPLHLEAPLYQWATSLAFHNLLK